MKTISYSFEPSVKNTRVHISPDTSQVAFANGKENFILVEIDGNKKNLIQKSLPQLKGKTVRFIKFDEVRKEFFFICCFDYDDNLDIQSSIRKNFDISFKKNIEPGCIEVFDLNVKSKHSDSDQEIEKVIRLASLKDQDIDPHIDL